MGDKKHYIELTHRKLLRSNVESKCEIANTNSWIISFKKDEKHFMCENKSSNKITKMKNVENFIRIWTCDIYNAKNSVRLIHEGSIDIYMENQKYSGYTCNSSSPVSADTIQRYVYLLKDIIEDENTVDKTAA